MLINIQILLTYTHTPFGRGGQVRLSVSDGNGSCAKEMWKPLQKKYFVSLPFVEKYQ